MDIDGGVGALDILRSPPIRISSPARQPVRDLSNEDLIPIPKLDHEAIREKAKKRKKNKKKGMLPAAPALNLSKGFQTPVTSGGEESDFSVASTPRLGTMRIPSVTASPSLRPSGSYSGLSALKARLEGLSLDDDRRPSLARVMSTTSTAYDSEATPSSRGSDGDKTELETYDVPLEQDFISPDAGTRTPIFASHAVEGGLHKILQHGLWLKDGNVFPNIK